MSVVMQPLGTPSAAVGRAVVTTAMTGAAPPPEAVALTLPDPDVAAHDVDAARIKRTKQDAHRGYRMIGDTA